MAVGTDLFDRCIDVSIYDESHVLIANITTPPYGPKPEIKVEGSILSNTYQISGKVTITNLERSVAIEDAGYLVVEMYYGGAATSKALRKSIIYKVLFADQSKQPPNRQVCFNCLVAGVTPDIMSKKTTIGKLDSNNKPLEQGFSEVLKEVIKAYNLALQTTNGSWYSELKLDSEPELRMTASTQSVFSSLKVAAQWTDTSISSILESLSLISVGTEPITKDSSENKEYLAFSYYIENNKLVVSENPSNKFTPIIGQPEIELNYVLSAYRYGPLIHAKTLFDPRIHQDTVLRISNINLSGKRVAGNLVPKLGAEKVMFRPVGGIEFAFSTTGENYMQMQGTMYL